jgi:glycosyltransferase involved in cell wall biosynthesis
MTYSQKYASIIITAHLEGLVLRDSIESVLHGLTKLPEELQINCEVIIILDFPDQVTLDTARYFKGKHSNLNYYMAFNHDVGKSRNIGIEISAGEYIYFLDGDDVWGESWLQNSIKLLEETDKKIIVHPNLVFEFGQDKFILTNYKTLDSSKFQDYLVEQNLWISSFCGHRDIFLDLKFPNGEIKSSCPYGYEDWSFFNKSIELGIDHLTADETIIFVRRKKVSITTKTINSGKIPWPLNYLV